MAPISMNLGRKPEWDQRNARFMAAPVDLGEIKSVSWRHFGVTSDQNGYGGCVGWMGLDWRNTQPAKTPGMQFRDADGLEYYNGATRYDQWPDNDRPPGYKGHDNDEGSSTQGLCRYFKDQNVIDGYEWADNVDRFVALMQRGPVVTGMDWTQDMFSPDSRGRVTPTGDLAGGHAIMALKLEWNPRNHMISRVWWLNHWTSKWGKRGKFYMTLGDTVEQYKRGMDAALMIPKGKVI